MTLRGSSHMCGHIIFMIRHYSLNNSDVVSYYFNPPNSETSKKFLRNLLRQIWYLLVCFLLLFFFLFYVLFSSSEPKVIPVRGQSVILPLTSTTSLKHLGCWPWWLSRMHVLVIRRSRVQSKPVLKTFFCGD